MLIEDLKKIGLDEREAAAYLKLLELGPSSILQLSKEASINRTVLYAIIEKLTEKKLISRTVKGKRKLIVAESPEGLKTLVRTRLSILDSLMPELTTLSNKAEIKPILRYEEGVEGIKDIYRGAVGSKEKALFAFVGVESLLSRSKKLQNFWDNEFKKARKKSGVFGKLIVPDNKEGEEFQKKDKANFRESRLVPATTYNFPAEILVYDDVVSIISYSKNEEFATSLESRAIAETMKMIWKLAWNSAY